VCVCRVVFVQFLLVCQTHHAPHILNTGHPFSPTHIGQESVDQSDHVPTDAVVTKRADYKQVPIVRPLGHSRLVLTITERSVPSSAARSIFATLPQSVQYTHLSTRPQNMLSTINITTVST